MTETQITNLTPEHRAIVTKLRYMARQYTGGSLSRGGSGARHHYLDEAADILERQHAEIEALKAAGAGVPAGWKIVPVEPTPEMIRAWPNNRHGSGHQDAIYRAMLSASPTPPDAGGDARDAALNVICRMFHHGEEFESDDGIAMFVPIDLWNEALDALDSLIGDDDAAMASQGKAG